MNGSSAHSHGNFIISREFKINFILKYEKVRKWDDKEFSSFSRCWWCWVIKSIELWIAEKKHGRATSISLIERMSAEFFFQLSSLFLLSFFFGCWVEKKARKEKKRIVELNLFRCETLESILVSLLIFSTIFFLQFRSIFNFPFFTVHWTNRAGHRRWLNDGNYLWFIHIKSLE